MEGSRRAMSRGAQEAMSGFIADMREWDLFGGLTFDQRRCRMERAWGLGGGKSPVRIPVDSARVRFQNFIGAAESVLGRRIEYVAALESHKNGWPHLHPLLSLEGGLQAGDIGLLGRLWYERQGYGRLEVPRSRADVTAYCAKYVSKDYGVGDLLMSRSLGRDRPLGRGDEGA
jgi:hypothetical protein